MNLPIKWIIAPLCALILISLTGCSTLMDMMPSAPTPEVDRMTTAVVIPTVSTRPTVDLHSLPANARPITVKAVGSVPGGVFKNMDENWVNIETAVKCTLEFYNVGALAGSKYSKANMTIDYTPLNNGSVFSKPDKDGNRSISPSSRYPYIPSEKYTFTFSGGPDGTFVQVGDKLLERPIMARMGRDAKGKLTVFITQGTIGDINFTLNNPEAFNAWN